MIHKKKTKTKYIKYTKYTKHTKHTKHYPSHKYIKDNKDIKDIKDIKHIKHIKHINHINHINQNAFSNYFLFAKKLYDSIEILTEKRYNDKEYYYIINKKYNQYFDNKTYKITDFLLYCLLRFTDSPIQKIIKEFVTFPARLPMKNFLATNDIYKKYNTFNKLLYLNNFIYYMLEHNKNINTIIKESRPNKWGYNVSTLNIDGRSYYNIYYVIKYKGDVFQFITLISIIYPSYFIDKHINELTQFIKHNKQLLQKNNLLTDVFIFYNNKTLDYNNKYIIIDGYYIPKCNIEFDETVSNSVIDDIVYYELNYPNSDIINKQTYVFRKLRNIEQLEKDLSTAQISKKEYNNMMRNIKPLCFNTVNLYHKFINELASIVITKFNNFIIKIIGSSTTFYSANILPHKKDAFYSHDTSDLDVCIIINENFDKYRPLLENPGVEINKSTGVYNNSKIRSFFGEDIMTKFFNCWGPQDSLYVAPNTTKLQDTILKRPIGIVIAIKENLYDYPDYVNNNKTCLTNFANFIKNGKTISYWDEHNKLITRTITRPSTKYY
jgi:hypothetical protein